MSAPAVDPYVRAAEILEWQDGDSVRVRIDYGFRQSGVWELRLTTAGGPRGLYVDCPETTKREPGALEALAYSSDLAPPGALVTIRTWKPRPETFGRYRAAVWTREHVDLGAALIAAGHTKAPR